MAHTLEPIGNKPGAFAKREIIEKNGDAFIQYTGCQIVNVDGELLTEETVDIPVSSNH